MNIPNSSNFSVDVIHSNYPNRRWAEMKVYGEMTLASLKNMLHYRTGTPSDKMQLYVYHTIHPKDGFFLPNDDSKTLGEMGIGQGFEIKIIAQDSSRIIDDDQTFTEEKIFKLTDEEYEKRPDNARNFLRQIRSKQKKDECKMDPLKQINSIPQFQQGQRCEILCLGGVRGEILSVGSRPSSTGVWIRIRLDEPLGISNVPDCDDGYGYYISVHNWERKLMVGDFPPVDLLECS